MTSYRHRVLTFGDQLSQGESLIGEDMTLHSVLEFRCQDVEGGWTVGGVQVPRTATNTLKKSYEVFEYCYR